MTTDELIMILTTVRCTFQPKKGFVYSFPNCELTTATINEAVKEITHGFDSAECSQLLNTIKPYRTNLEKACFWFEQNNKVAPIEYVCNLLREKTATIHEADNRCTANGAQTVNPDADSNTTPQPPTRLSRNNKDLFEIDKEALKALFLPVFFADDYKQRETSNETTKLSRFDIFIEQLESLLSDAKCNQTKIGNIAYMTHKSKFRKQNFRKFAPLCRLLFECCQIEAPKDQRPNKYNQPDNDTLERFSDALGNPLNPQK